MEKFLMTYINKKMWDVNIDGIVSEMVGTGCGNSVMNGIRRIIEINESVEQKMHFTYEDVMNFMFYQKRNGYVNFGGSKLRMCGQFNGIICASFSGDAVKLGKKKSIIIHNGMLGSSESMKFTNYGYDLDFAIDSYIKIEITSVNYIMGDFIGKCSIIPNKDSDNCTEMEYDVDGGQVYVDHNCNIYISDLSNSEIIDLCIRDRKESFERVEVTEKQRHVLGDDYCDLMENECVEHKDVSTLIKVISYEGYMGESIILSNTTFTCEEQKEARNRYQYKFQHNEFRSSEMEELYDSLIESHMLLDDMFNEFFESAHIYSKGMPLDGESIRLPNIPGSDIVIYTVLRECYRIAMMVKNGMFDNDRCESVHWESYVSYLAKRTIAEGLIDVLKIVRIYSDINLYANFHTVLEDYKDKDMSGIDEQHYIIENQCSYGRKCRGSYCDDDSHYEMKEIEPHIATKISLVRLELINRIFSKMVRRLTFIGDLCTNEKIDDLDDYGLSVYPDEIRSLIEDEYAMIIWCALTLNVRIPNKEKKNT